MTAQPSAISPEKEAQLNRWANLLPSRDRHYAFNYLAWLRGGAPAPEPRPGTNVSSKRAAEIRATIQEFEPWQ